MILTPAGAWRALGNVRDRVLEGPLADLRRMPRAAFDTGPGDPAAAGLGRAHGLARSGSVSTYRYAVHPTARLRGSPVLLVSPLGACGVAFDLRRGNSLVEHLVGEGRSVHQVDDEDLVGHGGAISPGPADLERWVDEILPHVVRTVSAHHEGAPVHLVGWSIGGLHAVLSAAGHPDLPLASVTAIATPFSLDEVPPVVRARPLAVAAGGPVLATLQTLLALMPLPALLRALRLGSLDELLTAPLTVLARLDDRDFLAQLEAVDDLRAIIGEQARLVGTYFRAMVSPGDLASGRVPVGHRVIDLGDLRRPVLLVAGENDRVVPPRAVRAGARLLTGTETRLTTAPGGHLGVLAGRSARVTTWARLCAFLDRHDAPATVEGSSPTSRRALRPASVPRRRAGEPVRPPALPPADTDTGSPSALPPSEDAERESADPQDPDTDEQGAARPRPARRPAKRPAPKRASRTPRTR
ncbi:alpha/beta fold hydrolase [Actinomycetospora cinnamomea]|uniref:Polyhydroxyalkanoate synthase n=1 Tax=Actinomycetospora cinnamomea TaxID=663609 RepID=A0A2U1FDA2_9PSEU|nr:alpha/beta fold hydrolase [Actinomycetospora cinnamomea]PVZ10175.1 polyhydroxyalkanoate synthase [Actinomycetospora cinnamomea]